MAKYYRKSNTGKIILGSVLAAIVGAGVSLGVVYREDIKKWGDDTFQKVEDVLKPEDSGSTETPDEQKPVVEAYAEYPFDNNFENAAIWSGTSTASAESNVQTLSFSFVVTDDGSEEGYKADFSQASYLVVNYKNVVGAPGLKVVIYDSEGNAYTMANGAMFYKWTEGEFNVEEAETGTVENYHITLESEFTGALVFDLLSFGEFDSTEKQVSKIEFTTDAKYNYGYQVQVGEFGILTYNSTDKAEVYETVFTTFDMWNTGRTSLTAENAAEKGTLNFNY